MENFLCSRLEWFFLLGLVGISLYLEELHYHFDSQHGFLGHLFSSTLAMLCSAWSVVWSSGLESNGLEGDGCAREGSA